MNGLIFWQKSKNHVLGEILGIFPKAWISLPNNKNKLTLSVFDPSDSLASCKISEKVYESLLRKTDNKPPDILTDLKTLAVLQYPFLKLRVQKLGCSTLKEGQNFFL